MAMGVFFCVQSEARDFHFAFGQFLENLCLEMDLSSRSTLATIDFPLLESLVGLSFLNKLQAPGVPVHQPISHVKT